MTGTPTSPLVQRWLVFNLVGAMGMLVQLAGVWVVTRLFGLHYLVATAVAVEGAVRHNFCWHTAWTWSDRRAGPSEGLHRLTRFHLTNGAVSLAGNVAVTAILVHAAGLHYLYADALAIAACSFANFLLSHTRVFVPLAAAAAMMVASAPDAGAADLSPAASAAFDRSVRLTEERLNRERDGASPFLWVDQLPPDRQRDADRRLHRGDIVVSPLGDDDASEMVGGLQHHWIATAFLAGTTLERVVALMQNYERYQEVYRPAVQRSRTIAHDGHRFTIFLQLFMKKIVSVVLDTESEVVYLPVGQSRLQVHSRSTRIAEVWHAGASDQREQPVGHDSGFLWRFNNYCALEQRAAGTYVQCESLSLTRDIPAGLGWLIGSFVTSIPRDSLEFTLRSMRSALVQS